MIRALFAILRTIWKTIFYFLVVIGLIVAFFIWKGLDARSNAGREAAHHEKTFKKLEVSDEREPTTYLVKGSKELPDSMKYDTSKWLNKIYKFNDYYGIDAEVHSLEGYIGQFDEVYVFADKTRGVAYVFDTSGFVWGYFNKNFTNPRFHVDDFEAVYDANELWKGIMLRDEARADTDWYSLEEGNAPFSKKESFLGIENRDIPTKALKEYGTLTVTFPDSGAEEDLAVYTFGESVYVVNSEGIIVGESVGIGDTDWEDWATRQGDSYRISLEIYLKKADIVLYEK